MNSNCLPNNHPVQNSYQILPGREQWALINQYKALQNERIKQKQRVLAQQKKNNFRRDLDNQMNSKSNVEQKEIEADRKYYQFITNQANMFKQKEQRQKYQKYIKRRQVQDQNNRLLDQSRNSRFKQSQSGYNLDIGYKSGLERKKMSQNIQRNVLDSLDQQLRHKQQQRQMQKRSEFQNDIKNLQYQYQKHENRPQPQKNFTQNEKVYEYYRELDQMKRLKNIQFEHKIVEEAAEKKKNLQDERIRNQQMKKYMIKQNVKETLDQQVRQHYMKKYEESKINPQDYSYGIISNVFREKGASYDKNKYIEELKMQVEEQKKKKKMQKFMSEQEYRFNMNQLNKVVNGAYMHNSYLDRSMGTIGDNKHLRIGDIKDAIYNEDAEVVKLKLQALRQRANSNIISRSGRTDRSF